MQVGGASVAREEVESQQAMGACADAAIERGAVVLRGEVPWLEAKVSDSGNKLSAHKTPLW